MEKITVNIPCLLGHLHVVANFTLPVIGTVENAQPAYIDLLVCDYEFPYQVKEFNNVATLHLLHVLTPQQIETVECAVYEQHLKNLYDKEDVELKQDIILHDQQVAEWKNLNPTLLQHKRVQEYSQLNSGAEYKGIYVEMPVKRLDPDLKY